MVPMKMANNLAGSVLIVAVDTRNRPPAFADEDIETDGVQNDTATRKVDENIQGGRRRRCSSDG